MERKDQVARGKHSLVESSPKSSSATVAPDVMRLAPEVLAYCLTNERTFYRQDVVRRNKQEGSLGVVMEVAGDLDSEGSTTDGSNIDDADVSKVHDCINDGADRNGEMSDGDLSTLPDGQVRIAWTDGSESTDNVNGITVVDRGFLHGDIVASASDPTGQLGLVVDVSIRIDLQTSNGEMIHNLTSKELKRIREFSIGDYVVWGPWLGRVNDVLDNVTVLFEDGSVCKVVKADPLRLKAVSRPVIDDANCPYYPGQRVRATSSVFRSARWLSGFWKAGRNEGTVIKVQTASVIVYWMSSAYPCIGTTSDVPSEEQNPNDLTLLSCFSYANWQLGDWCLLQPSVAIKTVDTGNVQETEAECGATCPEESLMDDSSFYDSMPRTTRIEQVLEVPNLSEGHQSSDPECTMLVVDSKNNQITETVGYDSVDHLVPEQILDCHTQNSFQSITESIKGVTNPTETIPVLQECGSCNITPSISREPSHDGWPTYRKKLRKVLLKRERKACPKDENFERALLIVNTVTKVDVAWQDGTREYGLDSICLIPINTPSDQEFFPEQYVLEKNSNEDDESVESNRVGIVRSVNSKDRTVCVRWFKPVSSPEDLREFSRDEIVSVYELDEHPDYDYCYGDVVVRLSPVSTSDSYLKIPPAILGEQIDVTESETAVSKHSEHKLELSEGEPSGKFRSLSWVGNITGLQDGDIEVAWADGMVSKVGPQDVYVVGREDDADSYGDGSDISDDNDSWETVDENEMDMLHDAEKEADSQCEKNILACEKAEDNPSEDIVPGKKGAFSASLAAINFVTRLATGLFSRNKRNSDLSNSENNALCGSEAHDVFEVAINLETDADLDISKHKSQGRSTSDAERIFAQQIESLASDASSVKGESEAFLHSFRHFDICDSPADHYYLNSIGQGIGGRKWVKRIQHEWGSLEKNLPDAIFVVVYEDRMDLLRAVIIGASGTPYQDGLFFFDFHFPPDYPQVPPLAYYHSGGLRINPNLYVDGKVCLSLLNTWAGRGNEVWDSSSSSILQVLVSLQGLVLNSKPYFNEAGYEKQVGTIEGEKNSVPYNENTYLLNLKSMMYMLRRPPMHFEGFVKDHFLRRGYYILKACEAYMGGCLIGTLTKDANITTEEKKVQFSSVGFKLMLVKILPRLVSALTDTGVDTHQFSHMIRPGYYH